MHDKSDPLQQTRPARKVTLWLDRENAAEACENYKTAFADLVGNFTAEDARTWDVAWAAAVAAYDYMAAGKVTPY